MKISRYIKIYFCVALSVTSAGAFYPVHRPIDARDGALRPAASQENVMRRLPLRFQSIPIDRSAPRTFEQRQRWLIAYLRRNAASLVRVGVVDIRQAKKLAREINPSFSTDIPDRVTMEHYARFIGDINWQVLVPCGQMIRGLEVVQGRLYLVRFAIDPATWVNDHYLGMEEGVSRARVTQVEASPAANGAFAFSEGSFAFIDPEAMAHDRTNGAYDAIIMADKLPPLLRGMVRSALARCGIDRARYQEDFGPSIVIAEEQRHAQDARFCEAARSCDLTRTPYWVLEVFHAIIKESSPLIDQYMISPADFLMLPVQRRQDTVHPVVEYAGQLGSLIAHMREAIADDNPDLAYALFLHYYALVRYQTEAGHAHDATRDYRDFLRSCVRGGYIKISRHFLDDASTAAAEEAEYFFMHTFLESLVRRGFTARTEQELDEALASFLEGAHSEHPAIATVTLLEEMYARDFFTDEERRAILLERGTLPAQAATPDARNPQSSS